MKDNRQGDEWLMGQVALGKRQFLEPLVRRYASPLLTYIQRMIGDLHQAEELFQEVFMAVWTKRKQYKFPRSFRAWLFAIAANRCRADYRKVRPVVVPFDETSQASPKSTNENPGDIALETETAALVATAVSQLPPQQRTAVVLRVWNGMSYSEIADVVGCAEATVRSHMHHALAGMRKYLEPRM